MGVDLVKPTGVIPASTPLGGRQEDVDARIKSGQSVLEPQRAKYQRPFSHAGPDPTHRQEFLRARTYHAIAAICCARRNPPAYVLTGVTSLACKMKMILYIHGRPRVSTSGGEARRDRGGRSWSGAPRRAAVTPPASRLCAGRRNRWLRITGGPIPTTRWPLRGLCWRKHLLQPVCGLRRVRRRRVGYHL
jgi:hypothetical protein